MASVELISEQDAEGKVSEIYEEIMSSLGIELAAAEVGKARKNVERRRNDTQPA
jgi:hypothetical protein